MSSFDSQRQESLKRRWQAETRLDEINFINRSTPSQYYFHNNKPAPIILQPTFSGGFNEDLVSTHVMPQVTVVLEGRSICHRISLPKHGSYQSLAVALRQMFVDIIIAAEAHNSSSFSDQTTNDSKSRVVDLSNAVPGHLIAYEDMENDLLLVGDLNWKDFVRVAKRIRILPAKVKSRKQKEQLN